jgi:Protein of unknown function (DUF3800)
MELLFIDESGDNGLVEGSTEFYILAGISIESSCWKECFWKILDLRRVISQKYGLRIDEIKGSHLFSHRGPFFNSSLNPLDLEWIYNQIIDLICAPLIECFAIVKSKKEFKKSQFQPKTKNLIRLLDERIWREYLTAYETYLLEKTGKTQRPQTALIYFDFNPSQEKHVRQIVREFSRKFDRQARFPSAGIVEDVIFRDSKASYFIQLADILAFSISRIVTGKGEHDVFSITSINQERLKAKIKGKI